MISHICVGMNIEHQHRDIVLGVGIYKVGWGDIKWDGDI